MGEIIMHFEKADGVRRDLGSSIPQERKVILGQYMTTSSIACFMAALFSPSTVPVCRLLDAGAGIGSLSSAFLERFASGDFRFERVEVSAYEIDDRMREYLACTLEEYASLPQIEINIHTQDFIEEAEKLISMPVLADRRFTHAILNPPYKKIKSNSRHRFLLRTVEIETVNLYSAFVALSVLLMEAGGEIVAILPRSFCNGPYYLPFRKLLLRYTAIRHIHLFESRKKAFRDDDVLQENVIIKLEKGGAQTDVIISTSTDDEFSDYAETRYPFERIVLHHEGQFIHVPTSPAQSRLETSPLVSRSLDEIGLSVSTGPVVEFRHKHYLRAIPEEGAVPLLYPCHFVGQSVLWPRIDTRKPNAISLNKETEKWIYPKGYYVVVRRFTSKEEKRRIVANVVSPEYFNGSAISFENHLNVIHWKKQGISEDLAHGLAAFLNSTDVDQVFRRFSGHTQVNATDLRYMRYPDRETLIRLGQWIKQAGKLTQDNIDKGLEETVWQNTRT